MFLRKSEKVEKWLFFGHFWAKFGNDSRISVLRFRCHCARRGTFGCKMTKFYENRMDIFEKFETFMKGRENKTSKLHN